MSDEERVESHVTCRRASRSVAGGGGAAAGAGMAWLRGGCVHGDRAQGAAWAADPQADEERHVPPPLL